MANSLNISLIKKTSSTLLIVSSLVLFASGCKDKNYNTKAEQAQIHEVASVEEFLKRKPQSEDDALIAKGMKAIVGGDLQTASRTFNLLLIDAPLDAHLHVLNAITYELMSEQNNIAKLSLAQAGYEQALKIDPHMTIASLQLGRISAKQKNYVMAQEYFATVLLANSHNTDAHYELARASYHLGDLKTGSMSINQALKADSENPGYLRAAALIYAALGEQEQANLYVARYSTLDISTRHKKHLERRVHDWENLHKSGRLVAQADLEVDTVNGDKEEKKTTTTTTKGAAEEEVVTEGEEEEEDAAEAEEEIEKKIKTAPEEKKKEGQIIWDETREGMIVVDAVIMRISETGTTRKGNNIMTNFRMNLTPGDFTRTREKSDDGRGGGITRTSGYSVTQGLSFGVIEYALDIANSRDQYAEIIGRPSLTATIGQEAKFTSGRDRKVLAEGQFGGNLTSTPIGTTLRVKVIKYEGDFITLMVELIGSSTEQGAAFGNNTTSFEINKDYVKTVVKVRAGETIMLAGITQRELSTSKSGVPILQNIPLIQYFFSEEVSTSERKSVMYILTPRSYSATIKTTKRFFARGQEFGNRPKLTELELRHKDWYDPSINNTLILTHLGKVYNEFRTGDLNKIKWGHSDQVDKQLASIANFMYF